MLWISYELGLIIGPPDKPKLRIPIALCSVVLVAANPILIQQLGSSFADITTAELVLAGWLLLATAVRSATIAGVVCAGVLMGLATALKLTNGLHAISATAVLLFLPLSFRTRIRWGILYGCALGSSYALASAPWSYRLYKAFGNPVFPLLNGLFRSPEFTTQPLLHFRFIPESAMAALWRPFAMMDPARMVHEELSAPDLRYALLFALAGMLLVVWLMNLIRGQKARPAIEVESSRVLVALGCGFAIDWVLWLSESGNGRYFLPMASVAAVLIMSLIYEIFYRHPKIRNYILASVFLLQAVQLYLGAEYRWCGVPWNEQWLDVRIPAKLRTHGNLFLTMGVQSNSFLIPFLAPDSGFVNFAGGYALDPNSANGVKVKFLIAKFNPNLRVLLKGTQLYADGQSGGPHQSAVNEALARFNLHVDGRDCVQIVVHGLPAEIEINMVDRFPGSAPDVVQKIRDTTYFLSCRIVPNAQTQTTVFSDETKVNLVLDRLEDACPSLFQPRRLYTEMTRTRGMRLYVNTDLTAWVSLGWVKFRHTISGDQIVYVGKESDWLKKPLKLECGRRDGHYFARVVDSEIY